MRNCRKNLELRKIEITTNFIKNADASCLIKSGDTHVVCTASIEEKIPRWLRGSGKGWVTAEYGMLPRSTHERMRREASSGKISGRTSEIQRLIGRSLRAAINPQLLGEYLITIDCDVLQADGGTRTAAITGGFIALKQCINLMIKRKQINHNPIKNYIAAISCGIVNGEILMDLNYEEDSNADIDSNYVMNDKNDIIELQLTGEKTTCSEEKFLEMLKYSKKSIAEIIEIQKQALSE